jgi:hypothetical protein
MTRTAISSTPRRLFAQAAAALAVAAACTGRAGPKRGHGRLAQQAHPRGGALWRGLVARRDRMRLMAEQALAPRLGQPVLVENRAGARRQHRHRRRGQMPGDGYTYVISTNGPLVYNTQLYTNLGYDPFTELRPVVLAGSPGQCVRGAHRFRHQQPARAGGRR